MGFCYFLDPVSKGGSGMYVNDDGTDDLAEVLELLPEYIVVKRKITDDLEATKTEMFDFQRAMASPTASESKLMDTMDAVTWWSVVGKAKFPLLGAAAKVLFAIPTSQASSERLWSIYEFIHNKRRNRLGHEKAAGLVIMYASRSSTRARPTLCRS